MAINKRRLLLAFAAFLTAITLALTGLAAYVIERQSEDEALHRLSQQLMQLQDDLQAARELMLAVALSTVRDEKNLSDLAVLYTQRLALTNEPDAVRWRALNLQRTVSTNRLKVTLGSAQLSSLAVYIEGELSHYALDGDVLSTARPTLVSPRIEPVERVVVQFDFPAAELMVLRVVVPIQAVLRESFNQTIAENLRISAPEYLRPRQGVGPTPKVIGTFVFSRAFDTGFLRTVAANTGVLPAVLSPDAVHRIELVKVGVPRDFVLASDDLRMRWQTADIDSSSYYEAFKRWRVEGQTVLILGAALARAGTLASVKQTIVIVAAAAGLILSASMAFGYLWISRVVSGLEDQVRERTAQLEFANKELESFSYSVSHDLRAPLRSIDGFSRALLEDYGGTLKGDGPDYLRRIRTASQHMGTLIDDMLNLAHMSRVELQRIPVDLTSIATSVADEVRNAEPDRHADVLIAPNLHANGDPRLLRVLLQNLFHNAWKFTSTRPQARIEFGQLLNNGVPVYYVRDDGVGFEMAYAHKLFGAFQRLHTTAEFPGTGVGLATVQRVVHRHGGRIWAEGKPGHGATFYFTLPDEPPKPA